MVVYDFLMDLYKGLMTMKKMVSVVSGVALAASLALTGMSHAEDDDPIAKAIKARQAGFRLYSYYAGQLFAMAKGDQEYEAELAATLAGNLDAVAHLNNGMMWMPGSDNEARSGKTRAKPNIWADDSDIGDKFAALQTATQGLAPVAGDGLDALRSNIGAVGDACKACHDEYRAKDF